MESNSDIQAKVEYIPIKVLDKEYYYANIIVEHENEQLLSKPKEKPNNSFLMILDRSGSMCGGPWKGKIYFRSLVFICQL